MRVVVALLCLTVCACPSAVKTDGGSSGSGGGTSSTGGGSATGGGMVNGGGGGSGGGCQGATIAGAPCLPIGSAVCDGDKMLVCSPDGVCGSWRLTRNCAALQLSCIEGATPACGCPSDGGTILYVDGTSPPAGNVLPTGVKEPAACRFKHVADAIGALPSNTPGYTVSILGGNPAAPEVLFETAGMQLPSGVTISSEECLLDRDASSCDPDAIVLKVSSSGAQFVFNSGDDATYQGFTIQLLGPINGYAIETWDGGTIYRMSFTLAAPDGGAPTACGSGLNSVASHGPLSVDQCRFSGGSGVGVVHESNDAISVSHSQFDTAALPCGESIITDAAPVVSFDDLTFYGGGFGTDSAHVTLTNSRFTGGGVTIRSYVPDPTSVVVLTGNRFSHAVLMWNAKRDSRAYTFQSNCFEAGASFDLYVETQDDGGFDFLSLAPPDCQHANSFCGNSVLDVSAGHLEPPPGAYSGVELDLAYGKWPVDPPTIGVSGAYIFNESTLGVNNINTLPTCGPTDGGCS